MQAQRTTKKDDYETPQELFDAIDRVFDFDWDVAASADNKKVGYWLEETDDSLNEMIPWAGTCWCNPPYSNWASFAKKACEQRLNRVTTVMLIPPRTDSKAWHEYIMQADEVIQLKGRVSFVVDGEEKKGNTVGSVLAVFRPRIEGIEYGPPKFLSWDWKSIME